MATPRDRFVSCRYLFHGQVPRAPHHSLPDTSLVCPLPSPRLAGCMFILGFGVQLPFSVATLVLPWLVQAAARPPATPPALLAGLPSLLSAALATSNGISVLAVARPVAKARPLFTVVLPVLLCAGVLAAAASAACLDAEGTPMSGKVLVASAIPLAVLLGAVAAVSSCGTASLATGGKGGSAMKAYTMGQSVAGVSTAAISFYAAAAVAAASESGHETSLAPHAAATLATSAAALVLSLVAYAALPPHERPSSHDAGVAEHCERDAQASSADSHANGSLTAPLLGDDGADVSVSEDGITPDDASEEAQHAPTVPPPFAHGDLRLYKAALFANFFVTCLVYPGIIAFLKPAAFGQGGPSDPQSVLDSSSAVHLPGGATLRGDLLVPATFVVFAAADLAGRVVATAVPRIGARPLFSIALARMLLLPCICMCNIVPPSGRWVAPRTFAASDAWPFLFLLLAAISNGFITSAALAAGPNCRPPPRRGAVATRMMAWLVGGITLGNVAGLAVSLSLQKL